MCRIKSTNSLRNSGIVQNFNYLFFVENMLHVDKFLLPLRVNISLYEAWGSAELYKVMRDRSFSWLVQNVLGILNFFIFL